MSGNASERCDVGFSLHKSSLFLQTLIACVGESHLSGPEDCERRSSREAVQRVEEQRRLVAVGSAKYGSEKASGIDGRRRAAMLLLAPSFVRSPYPYPQLVPKLRKLLLR